MGVGTSSVSSTVAANFHGKGILFRNNVNGDNTNWTRIHNTASTDRSNLLIQPATGSVEITQGGGLTVANTAGYGTIFNTNGVDADFRVESDGNTHMLFVDAGANAVTIGSASTSTASRLRASTSAVSSGNSIVLIDSANDANVAGNHLRISSARGDTSAYNLLTIDNVAGEILNISGNGSVVFNEAVWIVTGKL